MKLPLHIAEKLLQLMQGGTLAESSARHSIVDDLIADGIIVCRGRIKKTLVITNKNAFDIYLQTKLSINDLELYIETAKQSNPTRSKLVAASSDSKQKVVRTFKGFLINSYLPLKASINGCEVLIDPTEGIFQFIYDYEKFVIPPDIVVVGIENPENFRHISKQKYLFAHLKPLFISRYPQNQSKDLIKWLQAIPNTYLHFGDFDLAGIGIYVNEYKQHLAERASFFVPDNIEALLAKYGNRARYNNQTMNFNHTAIEEEKILQLLDILHKYKKGLDQEILIESKI